MAYVIKRYSNRKLYDLQQSRYVTLEELERLIWDGKDLSVVDAATGRDLTPITLLQVLLERERGRRSVLPSALLHQMIRHGDAWPKFLQTSLRSTVEGILPSQPETDRILEAWAARVGIAPPQASRESAGESQGGGQAGQSPRNEVETLREKIRELERKLAERDGGRETRS